MIRDRIGGRGKGRMDMAMHDGSDSRTSRDPHDGGRDQSDDGSDGSRPLSSQDEGRPSSRGGRKPEYGQIRVPKYGASAASFPESYDPYIYGAPQKEGDNGDGGKPPAGSSAPTTPRDGNPETNPGAPGAGRVDPSDPSRNPLYGQWDVFGPTSLVLALLGLPILPTVMGLLCMWRTRRFHMRGFGWGLAAVIVNVLTLVVDIWLVRQGVTADQLWSMVMGGTMPGSGSGSGSDSVSA